MEFRNTKVKYADFCLGKKNEVEKVMQLINLINYAINPGNYRPINQYLFRNVYYSKDWYIADTYHGIIGEYLQTDYRAEEEFGSYMEMLSKEGQSGVLKKKS